MSSCPRRAAAALAWGLAFVLVLQAGLGVVLDCWREELRDPEYGHKLARLRRRLAEHRGRPLLLALGSSRTDMGFRPECLAAATERDEDAPLAFNFGLSSAGPLRQLLCLQR